MTDKTGGPAFPFVVPSNNIFSWKEGLILRDYFAAKAMQAYVSDHPGAYLNYEEVANAAYQQADSMLKERMK